jgi:hypothetical protein
VGTVVHLGRDYGLLEHRDIWYRFPRSVAGGANLEGLRLNARVKFREAGNGRRGPWARLLEIVE